MATARGQRLSLVARQRGAVERLKTSLFGADPYVRRRYILDFHREFRSYKDCVSSAQVREASERADIIFVGDYHALPSCQNFAVELLHALVAGARPIVLFLEMIFARHQRALDRFLAGESDEAELRERIHYDRDWGYPWDGYGRLLSAARAAGVPVVAADAPPRSGLRMIRRRDMHAAGKIRARLQIDPAARAVVLFGESHLASAHLPREVTRELARSGMSRRSIVIVQNVEAIYWQLARKGQEGSEAVALDEARYCVFNASPLAKYEAYRQTLLRWAQQEDEAQDFGPSVHHLIDLLTSCVGLDRYRTTAPAPDGALAPLVDLYPEVVTRRERRRRSDPRPKRRRSRPGVVYRPAPNRIDVHAFSLASAGDAAARFLLAALRGRTGRSTESAVGAGRPSPGEGSRRTARGLGERLKRLPHAMTILDEAFVAFAVHYLDPGIAPHARFGGSGARASAPAERDPKRRRTRGRGLLVAAAGSDTALRRGMTRARVERMVRLGERLGEAIYANLGKGRDRRTARRWLLEVARFGRGETAAAREATARRLLLEAAGQAGWVRSRRR